MSTAAPECPSPPPPLRPQPSDAVAAQPAVAAAAAAAALPRSPSLTSLISFSVTSADKKSPSHSPSLITAPCSRCGHAEPIRSLLSVVERTVVRCQTCSTADAALAPRLDRSSSVSETLHRSFSDLESTLQRHGSDLDRLSLLPRLAPSKLTEIVDGDDSAGENRQQQQVVLARRSNGDGAAATLRPSSSLVLAENKLPPPEHIEYAAAGGGQNSTVVPHRHRNHHQLHHHSHGASDSHGHGHSNSAANSTGCGCSVGGGLGAGSGGGLPVHDVDDLKQLTAGVTRLLKTLHDRVSRLDAAERQLRSEREALRRDREEVSRLRQTLRPAGSDDGPRSRSPESRGSPVRGGFFTPRDRMSKSLDIADDGRTLPLSRAMSFATVDYSSPSRAEWTDEKEQQLAALERLLVRANRNWSDEQEDVLPMVEQLREERRKAKKLALSRHTSIAKGDDEGDGAAAAAADGEASPRRKPRRGSSLSFVMRRDSKSMVAADKKRRGSAGDESDGGDKARSSGLMRFFSKRGA